MKSQLIAIIRPKQAKCEVFVKFFVRGDFWIRRDEGVYLLASLLIRFFKANIAVSSFLFIKPNTNWKYIIPAC